MIGRELDGYWKTVVNTIRDGIMIMNSSGTIVSVNKAVEEITGYVREELIGTHCSILDDKGGENYTHYSGFLSEEKQSDNGSNQQQCRVRRKDGSSIQTLKTTAVLRDSSGNSLGWVGTITDLTEIVEKDNQLEAYRKQLSGDSAFHGIVGSSPAMQQVYDIIENAAQSDAPVIIYGESGTGKELVSRAIHDIGLRNDKPFVKVNCASLTESLLESELFGHVRGAFTGAYKDRIGRFEKANRGDLFLDEIGDLPLSTQIKLLRVLEEKVIERVGSSTPIKTDVRIISATNQDLPHLVEQGKFRNDFFFRINVIPIFIPPLRERSEDIPLLVESFFRKLSLKSSKTIDGVHERTMELMMRYRWPGNIRELKGALEYAFVTCHEGPIYPNHLPETISNNHPKTPPLKKSGINLQGIEKQELIDALERADGNQSQAAKLLGISRVTVWNRMKRFNIQAKRGIISTD